MAGPPDCAKRDVHVGGERARQEEIVLANSFYPPGGFSESIEYVGANRRRLNIRIVSRGFARMCCRAQCRFLKRAFRVAPSFSNGWPREAPVELRITHLAMATRPAATHQRLDFLPPA